jgi:hypothetical protein
MCPTAACQFTAQSLARHGLATVTPPAQLVTFGQRPKVGARTAAPGAVQSLPAGQLGR